MAKGTSKTRGGLKIVTVKIASQDRRCVTHSSITSSKRKQRAPLQLPSSPSVSLSLDSTMASGTATVKAVISGDTLVLVGAATNGPPPELVLTLASLQAPRLARSPEASNEVHSLCAMALLLLDL